MSIAHARCTGHGLHWTLKTIHGTHPHPPAHQVTGSLLFGAGELLERTIERTHAQEPVRVSGPGDRGGGGARA